jgi:diguanylate cyclase (GGDEF)-like protein/PAS domain S-box-containing protein
MRRLVAHTEMVSVATPTHRSSIEWLGLVLVLGLVAAVLAVALLRDRASIESDEANRIRLLSGGVEENLTRQLEGLDNALAAIRTDLERLGLGADSVASSSRLRMLSDAMPGVRTIVIADADATIVAASRSDLLGTVSRQRDFVVSLGRSPNARSLHVSPPFRSSTGTLLVVVAKRVSSPDGGFAGVVMAALDPAYFRVVLQSVLYAPDMRVALAHGDGKILVNMPIDEQRLGMDLAKPGSLFTQHQRSGQALTLTSGRVLATGDDRMMAIRTINGAALQVERPMVLAVSRQLSALYLPWREKATRFGFFFAVVALGSASGLFFAQRRRLAFDRLAATAAQERRQSAERLEFALQGAELGLWDLQPRTHQFVVNARERAMLGYAIDDALPERWRDLVHPDDLKAVDAAIVPHLRGETPAYECQHRMRHKDGHWVWVFSRAMIVERDGDGEPLRIVGTHLDISERKRRDAELERTAAMLRQSEERLSLALEASNLALFDWDIGARRIYHSAQASAMRGEPAVETTASTDELRSFIHPDDLETIDSHLKDAVTGTASAYDAEFRLRRRSGEWVWIRARGRVVERDANGRAVRLAGTYADIDERKIAEERLRRLAEHDPLTGLPNRSLFNDRLQQAMARCTGEARMALLFLDIDRFKEINDTLGHEAGDQVLSAFAVRMREMVRQTDTVARLAGDEFTLILGGLRGPADAVALAGKLVETLRDPITAGGRLLEVTASIGVAMCRPGETDEAGLLRRADAALYEAKRRGRNGFFCDDGDLLEACAADHSPD